MSTVRLNISMPERLFRELDKEVKSRQRSQFIANAVRESLKNKREQTLAAEYREAAKDIRKINQELEGTLADGLD